jgi:hypothetical protein
MTFTALRKIVIVFAVLFLKWSSGQIKDQPETSTVSLKRSKFGHQLLTNVLKFLHSALELLKGSSKFEASHYKNPLTVINS